MIVYILMFVAFVFFAVEIIQSHFRNWLAWGLAFMALALGALQFIKAIF